MLSINNLNKKPDFNLPGEYFERMQSEVLTKIHRYEQRTKQRRIFYSIGAVAASLFIVFCIVHFFPDENSTNLASFVSEEKESHLIYNNMIDENLAEIEKDDNNELPVSLKSKTSVKQMIAKIELDNLDYNIIEHYEESIYDLALLDLYY